MKSKFIFLIYIAVCFGCSTGQISDNKTNRNAEADSVTKTKGKLVCSSPQIKCGKIKQGEKTECSFLFYNTGTEPVKILEYKASCNCTELKFDNKDVQPGDSLKIVMLIDSKGKYSGPHSSTAILKTNGERTYYDIKADYDIE